MPSLTIEKDLIDSYNAEAQDFLQKILGMSLDSVLLTDLSDLQDFRFSGEFDASQCDDSLDLKGLGREWDRWVVQRINATYDLGLKSANIGMIALLEQLRSKSMPQTVH